MTRISFFRPSLIKAYVSFQANPGSMDAEDAKKMQEEMGMEDDSDATPKQKVEKYIVEQAADVSEEVKKQLKEMNEQQKKLLALGQAAAAQGFQAELDQKKEFAANQEKNVSDFLNKITQKDLTSVLKQVLSDDSENADEANIDIVAQLTNMIADKTSAPTVTVEA